MREEGASKYPFLREKNSRKKENVLEKARKISIESCHAYEIHATLMDRENDRGREALVTIIADEGI